MMPLQAEAYFNSSLNLVGVIFGDDHIFIHSVWFLQEEDHNGKGFTC